MLNSLVLVTGPIKNSNSKIQKEQMSLLILVHVGKFYINN